MIQQMIESTGWQQFISAGEVTASAMALLIGWGLTEMIKRTVYQVGWRDVPIWLWPILGFLSTLAAAVLGWPVDGVFPHRWLAALALAVAAPTIYTALIYLLRRMGWSGLASRITGNRRDGKSGADVKLERRSR